MQLTRIMAALWALCLKWFPLIKTASSLNMIVQHNCGIKLKQINNPT